MLIQPKGFFYQTEDNGRIKEDTKTPFSRQFSDNHLIEQHLILYASYELKRHYDLYSRFNIKKFSLKKPFYIEIQLGEQVFYFICQPIPVNYLNKLKAQDLPFRLKKTLFVVLPKSREIIKEKVPIKVEMPSDLNRLLNAIDAKVQGEFKKFSPVIYTGMIN